MKSLLKTYAILPAATVLGLAIGLATASAETYRIGLAVPVTGTGADAGKREAIGAHAAVTAINKAGGIGGSMIELFFADTGSNPQSRSGKFESMVSVLRRVCAA